MNNLGLFACWISKAVLLLWIIFVIYVLCLSCFRVCSLPPCGHLVWLLFVMFINCVFVTFPCSILGQVWYWLYWFLIFAAFLSYVSAQVGSFAPRCNNTPGAHLVLFVGIKNALEQWYFITLDSLFYIIFPIHSMYSLSVNFNNDEQFGNRKDQ